MFRRPGKNENKDPNNPFFTFYSCIIDGMNDKINHQSKMNEYGKDDPDKHAKHVTNEPC